MKPSTRKVTLILAFHLVAVLLGAGAGFYLSQDLPGIEDLNLRDLPRITTIYDRHGEAITSFGNQRRIPVSLDEISPHYLDALVAVEDPRFRRHIGVDLIAVARATLQNLSRGRVVSGASTITMQLVRGRLLHRRKVFKRKIQEAVWALLVEKHFSKDEILLAYANGMYLGHGVYGVEAASRLYFDKHASELTLAEGALLAGLAQRPEGLTPLRYPQRARGRRNHVLNRMVIESVIDRRTAEAAQKADLGIVKRPPTVDRAPYFSEQVRRWVVKRFGAKAWNQGGIEAHTTLDPAYQLEAERAVRLGLESYARRHRELPEARALPENSDPLTYWHPAWSDPIKAPDILPALVLEADEGHAVLKVSEQELELGPAQYSWAGKKDVGALLQPGTLLPIRVERASADGTIERFDLAAESDAQAAFVAMDAATGEIRALVGGRDFAESEWDRAMQARRQAGSAFKPFIFAAALESGFLPNDRLFDAPIALVDPGSDEPYQPENFENDYLGYMTLRYALEHSRNIPTVRLLDALGYDAAVDMARRLGIATDLKPYPSLALGAFEVRLVDLVAAYGTFVNGGVLVQPSWVKEVVDAEQQKTLFRAEPVTREILSAEHAAIMVSLLEGVVQRGSGKNARVLGFPVGGKTGTTDEYTDAWFVGFTDSLAVGVWFGFDQPKSLGRFETGARAALPIWVSFLEGAVADEKPGDFLRPPSVRRTLLDPVTGKKPDRRIKCGVQPILETFRDEDIPTERCEMRDVVRSRLPYPLQPFPLDENFALIIPPETVARFVTWAPKRLSLSKDNRRLRFNWRINRRTPELQGSVALAWTSEDELVYLQALIEAHAEAEFLAFEREQFLADLEEETERRLDEDPDYDAPDPEKVLPARFRKGVDGWPVEIIEVNRSGRVRFPPQPSDPPLEAK